MSAGRLSIYDHFPQFITSDTPSFGLVRYPHDIFASRVTVLLFVIYYFIREHVCINPYYRYIYVATSVQIPLVWNK